MADPAKSNEHIVKPGDRLSRIAFMHGYASYDAIWDDPKNQRLKDARKNPEILMPGDVVFLPDKTAEQHGAKHNDAAKHVHDTVSPRLKIHFSVGGEPVKNQKITVVIETDPYSKADPYLCKDKITTNANGYVELYIHALATEVKLRFVDLAFECHLFVGHLDPIDAGSGVAQRLNNLGYHCPVTPPSAPAAKKKHAEDVAYALKRFQLDAELKKGQTGTQDSETLEALRKRSEPGKPEKKKEEAPKEDGEDPMTAATPEEHATWASAVAALDAEKVAWREYYVTTNTDLRIDLPTLAVTARCAFFVPKGVLKKAPHGAETWVSARAVCASFERSKGPVTDKPVTLPLQGLVDADKKPIQAKTPKAHYKAGAAATVMYASADNYRPAAIKDDIALAHIPLTGLTPGVYVLGVVPPVEEQTKPDWPAGPRTKVPVDGKRSNNRRTYRPAFIRVRLDEHLHLVDDDEDEVAEEAAITCRIDTEGKVVVHEPVGADGTVPPKVSVLDPDGKKQLVDGWINHAYVTAYTKDELAVDLKPDVLRCVLAHDAMDPDAIEATKNETRKPRDIQLIVIHHTAGVVIGGAVNTAKDWGTCGAKWYPPDNAAKKAAFEADAKVHPDRYKHPKDKPTEWLKGAEPWGAQYEMDLDGHVVKFVPDDDVMNHVAPGGFIVDPEKNVEISINKHSIGIEVVHHDGVYPPYQMSSLLQLLRRLQDKYHLSPYRIVTHGDTESTVDDHGNMRLNKEGKSAINKLGDPGRHMDWPLLEANDFGRKSTPKDPLTATDYRGFFTIPVSECKGLRVRGGKKDGYLTLKQGDSDKARNWGLSGDSWNSSAGKAVLAKMNLDGKDNKFEGIIASLQDDLRMLGYPVKRSGEFSPETAMQLYRFVIHTFSGSRLTKYPRSEVPRESEPHDAMIVTKTIAMYLRGTADWTRKAREDEKKPKQAQPVKKAELLQSGPEAAREEIAWNEEYDIEPVGLAEELDMIEEAEAAT